MRALTPSAGADLVPAEAHQSTHGAERVFLFLFCFFLPWEKLDLWLQFTGKQEEQWTTLVASQPEGQVFLS